jgi:glutathione S-transferase
MITLWGRRNSINVQKALWCIEELGLPYERIDAGRGYGVTDTPEYGRMNPNRLVPTMADDGFVLWESNVIVRYLCAKHSQGNLSPADPRARAEADRWMDWQAIEFTPAFGPVFHGLVRTPGSRPREEIAAAIAKSETFAAILDEQLANRRYVAGDAFTMGDIPAGAAAFRWLNLPIERQPRPNIERYLRDILARPAAERVLLLPLT